MVATEPVRSWRQPATLRPQHVGDRVIFGSQSVLLNERELEQNAHVIGVPCEKRSLLRQLLRLVNATGYPGASTGCRLRNPFNLASNVTGRKNHKP